jgi:hypothetical protein
MRPQARVWRKTARTEPKHGHGRQPGAAELAAITRAALLTAVSRPGSNVIPLHYLTADRERMVSP